MNINDETIKAFFEADFESYSVDDIMYRHVYENLLCFFEVDENENLEGTQNGEE